MTQSLSLETHCTLLQFSCTKLRSSCTKIQFSSTKIQFSQKLYFILLALGMIRRQWLISMRNTRQTCHEKKNKKQNKPTCKTPGPLGSGSENRLQGLVIQVIWTGGRRNQTGGRHNQTLSLVTAKTKICYRCSAQQTEQVTSSKEWVSLPLSLLDLKHRLGGEGGGGRTSVSHTIHFILASQKNVLHKYHDERTSSGNTGFLVHSSKFNVVVGCCHVYIIKFKLKGESG